MGQNHKIIKSKRSKREPRFVLSEANEDSIKISSYESIYNIRNSGQNAGTVEFVCFDDTLISAFNEIEIDPVCPPKKNRVKHYFRRRLSLFLNPYFD